MQVFTLEIPFWMDTVYWNSVTIIFFILWVSAVIGPYIWSRKTDTSIAMATVISLLFGFIVQMLSSYVWSGQIFHLRPDAIFAMNLKLTDNIFEWYRLLSSAWLHDIGNYTHVLGNCLIIALVGVPLEQRLGKWRFMVVFIFSAIGGSLTWWLAQYFLGGTAWMAWGASGAAYGLLGCYIACWPKDKIEFPLIIIRPWPVEIIAGIYIMIELGRAYMVYGLNDWSGVAHGAHIGGFFFGAFAGRRLAWSGPVQPFSRDSGPSESSIVNAVRAGRKMRMGDVSLDPWAEGDDEVSSDVQRILDKLRSEGDEIETREAWLDKLSTTAMCPICSSELALIGEGEVPQVICQSDKSHLIWP
jgi:membrane associated rhomboid family serine protease